jgi:hypothetical protein
VRWLKYGLDHQDITYIEPLLADSIWYSLAFSDYPGEYLTKETFLWRLRQRLPNHPSCVSYIYRLGEINYLEISTEGWNPPWIFDVEWNDMMREWDYLVLGFSNQWTPEEGLYLFGAFVSRSPGVNDPNEISCR